MQVLALSALVVFAAASDSPSAPTFAAHPAPAGAAFVPADVRLESHPRAARFRTMLRSGAKEGPNFAGHYTIVTWGCGTACQELAIVDARSGEVHFPSQLQPNAYQSVPTDVIPPFTYRLDSRLLIVAGSPLDRENNIGLHYYTWNGRALEELLFVPAPWH